MPADLDAADLAWLGRDLDQLAVRALLEELPVARDVLDVDAEHFQKVQRHIVFGEGGPSLGWPMPISCAFRWKYSCCLALSGMMGLQDIRHGFTVAGG